jgi:hypothetical protein
MNSKLDAVVAVLSNNASALDQVYAALQPLMTTTLVGAKHITKVQAKAPKAETERPPKNMNARILLNKWAGRCAETGDDIPAGTECLYVPSEKGRGHVYTLTSAKAKELGFSK